MKIDTCQKYDQMLLMRHHRALGVWSKIKVALHLCQCPDCRERSQRFAEVSSGFSRLLRPEPVQATAFAGWSRAGSSMRRRGTVLVALLAIITAASALYVQINGLPWGHSCDPPPVDTSRLLDNSDNCETGK